MCEPDGSGSTRAWLVWQTQVTRGAAAGAIGRMRRLRAHPGVWEALAAGTVSASWARQICDWTDRLPEASRAAASGLTRAEAEALACDATIFPVITGTVENTALDRLVQLFLNAFSHGRGAGTGTPPGADAGSGDARAVPSSQVDAGLPGDAGLPSGLRSPELLRQTLLALAADVLSGPGGLASLLRTQTPGVPFPTVSLPLDTGTASEVIPGHLRRLVILRDKHCRFPGCWRKPAACQVHHLIHREDGGPTSLANCYLVCRFHHLIAIHRWGGKLTANPDGTTTATSPTGRVLHSHSPPGQAA